MGLFENFVIIVLSASNPKPALLYSYPKPPDTPTKDDTLNSLPQFCFPDEPFSEPDEEEEETTEQKRETYVFSRKIITFH